jgi:hypothetical protein
MEGIKWWQYPGRWCARMKLYQRLELAMTVGICIMAASIFLAILSRGRARVFCEQCSMALLLGLPIVLGLALGAGFIQMTAPRGDNHEDFGEGGLFPF